LNELTIQPETASSKALTIPSLPPSVLQLLDGAVIHLMEAQGLRTLENQNWVPPEITPGIRQQLTRETMPALERFLAPAQPDELALRVAALLGHYFVSGMDVRVQALIADDWIRLLEPYPMPVLGAVMDEWLRQFRQRPTIADLIQNCETLIARPALQLKLLRKLLDGPADGANWTVN
jgi:hypothetical protein